MILLAAIIVLTVPLLRATIRSMRPRPVRVRARVIRADGMPHAL